MVRTEGAEWLAAVVICGTTKRVDGGFEDSVRWVFVDGFCFIAILSDPSEESLMCVDGLSNGFTAMLKTHGRNAGLQKPRLQTK